MMCNTIEIDMLVMVLFMGSLILWSLDLLIASWLYNLCIIYSLNLDNFTECLILLAFQGASQLSLNLSVFRNQSHQL